MFLILLYNILAMNLCLTPAGRYWIEFNKWAVFVNDDLTRSFISLEVTGGGLSEVLTFLLYDTVSLYVLVAFIDFNFLEVFTCKQESYVVCQVLGMAH